MKKISLVFAALMALALPGLAVPVGDDGLHKPDWLHDTFKDMREDLAEATAQGKRLMILWEQRGCIYCSQMHEEVFTAPEIEALIHDNYHVIQMNLFGDVEVTDLDGTVLPEKEMAKRWNVVFTPTLIFLPESAEGFESVSDAAVVAMPGAFGKITTKALLTWVLNKGYEGEEHFQKYVARMAEEAQGKN
ncbi:thioredoxin-related protein [Rhodovulum imhoffii]|uniref:Thioredoxin-related protein n=1 Tax=Rhodovulum imhoffii TaxID=365340 RepID=A0A2T5BPV7_9RHOB|nr:thioredoxin family protein [Rhodovulum imhoffii]MBK5934173.1 thioredoxin [Rhodovulum imhoffii]PTN01089.1 thioredoxin-related protein [Rhodovulum imhoffii]